MQNFHTVLCQVLSVANNTVNPCDVPNGDADEDGDRETLDQPLDQPLDQQGDGDGAIGEADVTGLESDAKEEGEETVDGHIPQIPE